MTPTVSDISLNFNATEVANICPRNVDWIQIFYHPSRANNAKSCNFCYGKNVDKVRKHTHTQWRDGETRVNPKCDEAHYSAFLFFI